MEIEPRVQFDDTGTAFSYKSSRQLRKANLIFTLVNNPVISPIATTLAKYALKLHLPFVKPVIRATIFEHFCGGETIEESAKTVATLNKFHVGTILDYSVEGEKTEQGFEDTTKEILRTIEKAKDNPGIPFSVFKVTGMADTSLLGKKHSGASLTPEEQAEFKKVQDRVERICSKAHECNVPVLIDAEETWIQNPIDELAYDMMRKFNQKKAIVLNTFQMYRKDMPARLREALQDAVKDNYFLGVKLVRGAYMEKEAAHAEENGYENPIHPTKEDTDKAFNKGLTFCLDNKQRIMLMCGSHNDYSNKFLTVLMEKHGMKPNDPRVWFAQLLGMSDHITFNLSKAGYNVAKYVPYGPVPSVMPYLIRRAQENTSVAGQSSRELQLIRKELQRRKDSK
ncbi:MAG TPA: proline dehydrogenase family protein [Cyclobacteriaceae bacterium]|nr:proline dehydrogenase family protein [Cyclobacteriaceae bacterium]